MGRNKERKKKFPSSSSSCMQDQHQLVRTKHSGNMYTSHTCVCVFGADSNAQSVLINKISASELDRKFIKSALLVGEEEKIFFFSNCFRIFFLFEKPNPRQKISVLSLSKLTAKGTNFYVFIFPFLPGLLDTFFFHKCNRRSISLQTRKEKKKERKDDGICKFSTKKHQQKVGKLMCGLQIMGLHHWQGVFFFKCFFFFKFLRNAFLPSFGYRIGQLPQFSHTIGYFSSEITVYIQRRYMLMGNNNECVYVFFHTAGLRKEG